MGLFTEQGLYFIFKWIHFLAGVAWIGHLYYFNFVQGAFFAEIDANTKNISIQKLVPKALWWFRWGAMFTLISGVLMLGMRGHAGLENVYTSPWGVKILVGALLGLCMWANVWFIIWPKQKILIASANQVLGGGQALPEAAAAGPIALRASRTNTMFSIALLFFMGAAANVPDSFSEGKSLWAFWAPVLIVILGLEWNAIKGKIGWMTTVKGVITCGFALTALLYGCLVLFSVYGA
jgi:uncharacterized membrane protein